MKRITKKNSLLVIIAIAGVLCYGFASKRIALDDLGFNSGLETEKVKSGIVTPPPPEDILGTWEDESESGHKFVFNSTGTMKIYSENVLVMQLQYAIANTCNGQSFDGQYLKMIDPNDGTVNCYFINNLSDDTLSIMGENGHTQVYIKQ